jgi:predicted dehydrogenase
LALFGLGRWGVHWLRNFLAHPAARVVAIADPSPQQLAHVQQQFALEAQSLLLTADWQEAMAHPAVDAVAIITPAATHYDLIKAALSRQRHVLVEKPLALDLAQAVEVCQLAEQRQCQLLVDHTYMFHPAIQQGRNLLRAGQLGAMRYGYATRSHLTPVRHDVDALWDLAIHDLVILNDWLDEHPIQVRAQGQVWLQPTAVAGFPQGLADTVWATLTYPSGVEVTVHVSWLNPDRQRRLGLVGSEATLIFDELAVEPLVCHHRSMGLERSLPGHSSPWRVQDRGRQVIDYPGHEPLAQVCDHFLSCVRHNRPSSLISGWHGAEVVGVLEALALSMQHDGKSIPVWPHLDRFATGETIETTAILPPMRPAPPAPLWH